MKTEDIRLGKSALSDKIYAGKLDKSGNGWRTKKDVTSDFYHCVVLIFSGHETIIKDSARNKYRVIVEAVEDNEK